MAPRPKSPYAVQKLLGEYYASVFAGCFGLETVSLRFFNVFGPRQDPTSVYSGVLSIFLNCLIERRSPTIYGDGEQSRDFTYVEDVVGLLLKASSAPASVSGKVFNAGNGNRYTLNETWTLLQRIEGVSLPPNYGPPRSGDVKDSQADTTAAVNELGHAPRFSFEQGLRLTLDWYRAEIERKESRVARRRSVSLFERGGDGIYRCSAFDEFPWQRHGFGSRSANPPVDVTLRQIHSNITLNARGLGDREREGDALVTDEIGRAVGVRTADCVPILLLDRSKRAVSAIHAGWRGTAAQIVSRTIQKLQDDFGCDPNDLLAAIGPCIRHCCYQVGSEVAERFSATYTTKDDQPGKWHLDLAAANRRQLLESGILPDRIFDLDTCTVCQGEDLFSYRREPDNPGRMISSIQRIA